MHSFLLGVLGGLAGYLISVLFENWLRLRGRNKTWSVFK